MKLAKKPSFIIILLLVLMIFELFIFIYREKDNENKITYLQNRLKSIDNTISPADEILLSLSARVYKENSSELSLSGYDSASADLKNNLRSNRLKEPDRLDQLWCGIVPSDSNLSFKVFGSSVIVVNNNDLMAHIEWLRLDPERILLDKVTCLKENK
jgi:hypothetical protein